MRTGPVLAVVVAGGRGERMGADAPKQFLEVAGRPLLVHALLPFESHPAVEEVTVVLPAGEEVRWKDLLRGRYGMRKVARTVTGGARRTDSVLAGVRAALGGGDRDRDVLVAVHDAARPLAGVDLLERVVQAAREHGAAIPALEVADTVVRSDGAGFWQERLEREGLLLVQTPQVFRADWLLEAHTDSAGQEATDDAQLVHAAGHPVRIVAGERSNLKVTGPQDLEAARVLLEGGLS